MYSGLPTTAFGFNNGFSGQNRQQYIDTARAMMMPSSAPKPSDPNAPQRLNYDAAVRQAQAALDPQYQRMLNTTLQGIDRNSIARGFYGQMPTDVFKRATAGDLAMQHQGNIAQYANQLQQQSFNNQMAYDQFQFQKQQYGDGQSGQMWETIGSLASILLPLLL